jgi:hypothetical protein
MFVKHIDSSRVVNLSKVKEFFKTKEGNFIVFEYVGDTYSKWEFQDEVGRDIMYNTMLDLTAGKK